MKTGVVFKIVEGRAIIMKTGGEFVNVPVKNGWQKGDVVKFENSTVKFRMFYQIAACFFLIMLLGFGGYKTYFEQISIVSIDVNPSIEINLNRFERVIDVLAYNDEGKEIIKIVNIKHKKYNEALILLMADEAFDKYLGQNSYLTFSIQSNDVKKEDLILNVIKDTANTVIIPHHQSTNVEYYTVDGSLVTEAHNHGVSAGKYATLLQFKEVSPEIDIASYTHHSIQEIKEKISKCESEHDNSSNDSISNLKHETPSTNIEKHGHGGHH